MTAFLIIWWAGMIGTGSYYWFTQGRTEEFLVGRLKTTFVVLFWPVFLIYLYLVRQQKEARQVSSDEVKKRILG